ncbi:hypothetical protein KDH_74630 [Dictyobacter sp. S3.2.2.5]|uniref:Cupin type-2 domain-containing protein n=1 Tax=Dictyobacter halimunensis TaxID=3026934 RepID=A0ABQ6G2A1_9CHLR|nr:hypothetical protein KDH_74630 [Dictyobacter sp. S3.2.2.5]
MSTYPSFQRINLKDLYQRITDDYQNFIVNEVDESCMHLAVMTGTYPWHRHPDADELFLVLEGELIIEFKEHEAVTLHPYEIFTIPAGIIHRTRTTQRSVNLCFEHTQATTEFV